MKKIMKVLLSVVVVIGLFASVKPAEAQKTLADIQEAGELVVGTSADFPPFEWVVLDGGEAQVVGIDADLAQLIADEIGVELVIEDTSFDGLIPSVSSGRVDMVLAGMTYSEERAEQVDFSEVYYETNSKFVVPVGEEGNFESIEDFAAVTAKGNTELMEAINKVIADVTESGQMEEIVTKNTELNAEQTEE